MDIVEKVARAICKEWFLGSERTWQNFLPAARAAIEAMREIPVTVQMAGCEGQMFKSIEFDGPLKKHEECNTPDDWMQRGHGLKNRMLSGDEFLAGWNAAIDAALHPIQNGERE